MATYNGAKFLQEQLDSFQYQSRLPDELVVCDDGSTDSTLSILESFAAQASFEVRIVRNECNLGYTRNFEKALSLCTGDVIFLSDQDDVWFCNKLAEMIDVFIARPDVYVAQANMVLTDEDMRPTEFTQLGNILALGGSKESFVAGCGTAIRRSWLSVVLPIPAGLATHDNWIHRLASPVGICWHCPNPLQYYRRHDLNASNGLASAPVRLTGLSAFRIHGFQGSVSGWSQELQRMEAALERLHSCAQMLESMGLGSRNSSALALLRLRCENLASRIRILSMGRLARVPAVIGLWWRGGYRQFSGWKSVTKDLLRPRDSFPQG